MKGLWLRLTIEGSVGVRRGVVEADRARARVVRTLGSIIFSKKWREGPSRRRMEERGKRKGEWRVEDERCQSSEGAERSRKKTVEAEEDPA